MTHLWTTALAASLLATTACGGESADSVIAEMGKMADKLCACNDVKCAEAVMKEMSRMKEPPDKPTKAQMERAMAIAEKMTACQKQLMAAAPPVPPIPPIRPPAPLPPAPSPPLPSARCDEAVRHADRAFSAVSQAQAEARAAAIALDRACRVEASLPATDLAPAPAPASDAGPAR